MEYFSCYKYESNVQWSIAFNGIISSWNTASVTNMASMFSGASLFNPGDLTKWDTSAVRTMGYMFYRASAFKGDISSWNTASVTDMRWMFSGASSFNPADLSNWDC